MAFCFGLQSTSPNTASVQDLLTTDGEDTHCNKMAAPISTRQHGGAPAEPHHKDVWANIEALGSLYKHDANEYVIFHFCQTHCLFVLRPVFPKNMSDVYCPRTFQAAQLWTSSLLRGSVADLLEQFRLQGVFRTPIMSVGRLNLQCTPCFPTVHNYQVKTPKNFNDSASTFTISSYVTQPD